MISKPLVYIAGPISGDPFGCVRESGKAFDLVRDLGAIPFLPQLSVLLEMVSPHWYEDWMAYDLDVITRCDALVRLEGESPGADREMAYAEQIHLPVFMLDTDTAVREFLGWRRGWTSGVGRR